MRMMISGLPSNFDKYDLQRLFSPFGWVAYSKIYVDPITMKSRCKGVVDIQNDEQAKQAMASLQGKVFGGKALSIKEVKEKKRFE
jgi:RNA recognition motif-containing protein